MKIKITREKGGLEIDHKPIKVRMDSFEMRNSISPSVKTTVENLAEKGRQAASEAVAKYASRGKYLLPAKPGDKGEALQQMWNAENAPSTGEFELTFIPRTGPKIDWEAHSLIIKYQMDKLHFSAKME